MAQVNKVSTEVRNPTESTFEKPIAEVSKHEKQPDNEFLVENIGSPIFLQDRDSNDEKNIDEPSVDVEQASQDLAALLNANLNDSK